VNQSKLAPSSLQANWKFQFNHRALTLLLSFLLPFSNMFKHATSSLAKKSCLSVNLPLFLLVGPAIVRVTSRLSYSGPVPRTFPALFMGIYDACDTSAARYAAGHCSEA
jgi:hypothetical protein